MKILTLLMRVGQFGFSAVFPTLFFLLLASWLQHKFDLGIWVVAALGILGLLISISTTKSCLHAMRKAAQEVSSQAEPPVAFNDHH